MGYVSEHDTENEHEGWVAMTYADGKVSSGTSNGSGHYLDGYKYLSHAPGEMGGRIDPIYLRPFVETVAWLPRCICGWDGIAVPVADDPHPSREPSDEQENLIMYQWRLHIRDTNPEAYR